MAERQIVASGGSGFFLGVPSAIDRFCVELGRARAVGRPRACYLGTASGDRADAVANFHRAYGSLGCDTRDLGLFERTVADIEQLLVAQDVIFVGGGNTVSLLAVWRAHGVDRALRSAYEQGTVLAGSSAGMNCWFEASVTDSFDLARLDGVRDGLGLLAGSACPHYDGEAERRPTYHRLVAAGFPAGYAAEDGVALHFVDERLAEAVAQRPGARAFAVSLAGGDVTEDEIVPRYLVSGGRDVPV